MSRSRFGNYSCVQCGKEFKLGDQVVSKMNPNGKTQQYHQHCYDELWLEI